MRHAGMQVVQDGECCTHFRSRASAALQDGCKMAARWAGLRGRLRVGLWLSRCSGASHVAGRTSGAYCRRAGAASATTRGVPTQKIVADE
jgi:hypothetical protein